jgi:hypothetical protein
MSGRLRSFLFTATAPDGTRRDLLFYAATAVQATKYAFAWASTRGLLVELVRDENEVAA